MGLILKSRFSQKTTPGLNTAFNQTRKRDRRVSFIYLCLMILDLNLFVTVIINELCTADHHQGLRNMKTCPEKPAAGVLQGSLKRDGGAFSENSPVVCVGRRRDLCKSAVFPFIPPMQRLRCQAKVKAKTLKPHTPGCVLCVVVLDSVARSWARKKYK